MKSPEMSPSRKDPIINQDSNRIINKQDPTILPLLEKYPTGYKLKGYRIVCGTRFLYD